MALLTDFVFGTATMVVTTTALALAFVLLWWVLPPRRRVLVHRHCPRSG